MATITAANSVFMLGVQNLYNVPVKMQGYAADDAFASESVEFMEKYMGVDGKLSAGFTPYIVPFDFTLQADSDSNLIIDAIIATEKVLREKLVLNATILIPSTGFIYAFTKGYLDKGPVMPSSGKTLKPRKYSLSFQDVSVAPV
jgi:hypothetical protein